MRYHHLIPATAMLGIATQANADVISIDCGFGNTSYHVWVDTDKSLAMVKGYGDGSYPAQITPISITWSANWYGSPMEVIVDRTAGTIRWHILPNNQGNSLDRTDSCTKGSEPFPATKF